MTRLAVRRLALLGGCVESTWNVADDSYGFRVYSITGDSNINGWSGDKGADGWYSG